MLTKSDLFQAGKVGGLAAISWATPPRSWRKAAAAMQHRWPIELCQRTTIRFYPLSMDSSRALVHDTWRFIQRRINEIFRPGKRTTWRSSDGDTVWD